MVMHYGKSLNRFSNPPKPSELAQTKQNRTIVVVKCVTINCYTKLLALLYSTIFIGPEFHRQWWRLAQEKHSSKGAAL